MGQRGTIELVMRDPDSPTVLMVSGSDAPDDAPLQARGFVNLGDFEEQIDTSLTFDTMARERIELRQQDDTVWFVDRTDESTLPFAIRDYHEYSLLTERYVQISGLMEGRHSTYDLFGIIDPWPLLFLAIPAYCIVQSTLNIRALRRDARESREMGIPTGIKLSGHFGPYKRIGPDGTVEVGLDCGVAGETVPLDPALAHRRRRFQLRSS